MNKNSQLNLILPLSCSFSRSQLSPSMDSSLIDVTCDHNDLNELVLNVLSNNDDNNENDQRTLINLISNKSSALHNYKYSRRERDLFYASVKRAILKKNFITKKLRKETSSTVLFNRQHSPSRNVGNHLRTTPNNSMYPLLFDPHFNLLVQMPSTNSSILLNRYLISIQSNYNLLHSIASQEFQIVIHSDDRRHCFSHSSSLFIHTLRQCMFDYATSIQTTSKRNYLATFQQQDEEEEESTGETETFVPPLKIRRFHSCEKKNRTNSSTFYPSSSSTTSSSSSGMSIIQVNHGPQQQLDEQQRLNARAKRAPVRTAATRLGESQRFLPVQTNGTVPSTHTSTVSFADVEKEEIIEVPIIPLQPIVPVMAHKQIRERTTTDPFLYSSTSMNEHQKPKKSSSPIFMREHISEPSPKYQSVHLSEGARIRIVNCSNDNNKHSSTRHSRDSTIKKLSSTTPITVDRGDENWATKSNRIHTRHVSTTINSTKHPDLLQLLPPYQPKPIVLLPTEMSQGWLNNAVFYRCHACAHEEFFVVPSRECMNLHISSKHGNMEDNFKQRISNFRNNQGRALRIFQHYLKWQQPWSETEIDRLFQLSNTFPSNVNERINGEITNLTNKAN